MATYSFYAYSSRVLTFNATTNTFDFAAGYDPATDRILVAITDDDPYLDGDRSADELGEDRNQTAVISTPDGTVLATGQVYIDAYAEIESRAGEFIWIDRIEIAGVHYGYFSSAPLTPGESYAFGFSEDVDDDLYDDGNFDTRLTYDQVWSVPCFASGTRIATDCGEVPVERIGPGTRVLTRDSGPQPVLWTGRTPVTRADMVTGPHRCPVIVLPGALGPGAPRRMLIVSRQHRILLSGPECELLFGVPEVFAAAGHLVDRMDGIGIGCAGRDFCYHHILLPRHEVILSEGAWTESFLAAREGLGALGKEARRELHRVLGANPAPSVARRCLRDWEVEVLVGHAVTGAARSERAA